MPVSCFSYDMRGNKIPKNTPADTHSALRLRNRGISRECLIFLSFHAILCVIAETAIISLPSHGRCANFSLFAYVL